MGKELLRTLVLNADYTPYSIWGCKKAFCKLFEKNTINCIEYYDEYFIDGSGNKWPIPSIVVLNKFVHQRQRHTQQYNRTYVYIRDNMECQYCTRKLNPYNMSIDHVIPKSVWKKENRKGSYNNYNNVVACCVPCNTIKGDKKPEEVGLKLIRQPANITRQAIFKMKLANSHIPESWKNYVEVSKKEASTTTN